MKFPQGSNGIQNWADQKPHSGPLHYSGSSFLNSATSSHGQKKLGQASVQLLLVRLMTGGPSGPIFGKERKT